MENKLSSLDRIESRLLKLDVISGKLNRLKHLDELLESMIFFNSRFESFCELDDTIRKENQSLKKENLQLRKTVERLELKIDDLDTYQRRTNIKICNVPVREGESTNNIISKISESLEVPLQGGIEACHRVPPKNKHSKPIVVRFVNRRTKENLMQKSKIKRMNTKDLGFSGHALPVYLSEAIINKK